MIKFHYNLDAQRSTLVLAPKVNLFASCPGISTMCSRAAMMKHESVSTILAQ